MLLLYRQNSKYPAFIKIIRICKQEQVVRSRSKRTSGYRTFSLEGIELPVQEDFVSQIHDRELLERIEGYVSGLSPSLQAVFRLRLYGERSFGEIAAALGQSESAVKSQYYRLLGRIREEFDPHE